MVADSTHKNEPEEEITYSVRDLVMEFLGLGDLDPSFTELPEVIDQNLPKQHKETSPLLSNTIQKNHELSTPEEIEQECEDIEASLSRLLDRLDT